MKIKTLRTEGPRWVVRSVSAKDAAMNALYRIRDRQYQRERAGFWMFFTQDVLRVQIEEPIMANIEDMKANGMIYAVKGFRNRKEMKFFDKLCEELFVSSAMFSTRCLGSDFFLEAFDAMMHGEELPGDMRVQEEIEKSRMCMVKTDADERRMMERGKYYQQMLDVSKKLKVALFPLLLQGRVWDLRLGGCLRP